MAWTRKSEIMVSVFAIDSNDFIMQEYEDNNKEETHQEDANQPAKGPTWVEDSDGPLQHK
jgi:hypothetical protein